MLSQVACRYPVIRTEQVFSPEVTGNVSLPSSCFAAQQVAAQAVAHGHVVAPAPAPQAEAEPAAETPSASEEPAEEEPTAEPPSALEEPAEEDLTAEAPSASEEEAEAEAPAEAEAIAETPSALPEPAESVAPSLYSPLNCTAMTCCAGAALNRTLVLDGDIDGFDM